MFEAPPLFRGSGPAEDLEAAVDLNRVAGDSHRILATLAQQLGRLDRNARLADRGGPEYGQDPHRGQIVVATEEDEWITSRSSTRSPTTSRCSPTIGRSSETPSRGR